MYSSLFDFLKQFFFRLLLTGLGQYSIVVGITEIDSSNSIADITQYIPFTALLSTVINTVIFTIILFIICKMDKFRAKIMIATAYVTSLFFLSILMFISLEGFVSDLFAYLLMMTIPFLAIELILFFIRNRRVL